MATAIAKEGLVERGAAGRVGVGNIKQPQLGSLFPM